MFLSKMGVSVLALMGLSVGATSLASDSDMICISAKNSNKYEFNTINGEIHYKIAQTGEDGYQDSITPEQVVLGSGKLMTIRTRWVHEDGDVVFFVDERRRDGHISGHDKSVVGEDDSLACAKRH